MADNMNFDRTNSLFHQIIMAEDWEVNKVDVAELYLNDQLQEDNSVEEWIDMNGLTVIYVPGFGKLQMVWIEDDNDTRS
jgi:hypothetical protein|tara:strand:- start:154 stop:390 length:237 start_codon:yes stop_codon:yes gene_type:complete